jgi:glycosyltransferase involved in cell wall biosynthesis
MYTADIIVPTYNRLRFLKNCIKSIVDNTQVSYRLFIIDDCSNDGTSQWLAALKYNNLETVILNKKRRGLCYGFDILWDHIRGVNWFNSNSARFMVLLQDDTVVVEEGWLKKLIKMYERFNDEYNIGFFSGHDAPEHPTIETFTIRSNPCNIKIKKSMRATNMIATWEFWKSIGKVPRVQPDGTNRGFPSPAPDGNGRGRGSNFDIYLTGCASKGMVHRNGAKQSCYAQGKTCLVIPGLVQHIALDAEHSTWGNKNQE